jgi:hypothetical protein
MMDYIWRFSENNRIKNAHFSPLNGYEPPYDPDKWNKKKNILKTHNCYAYMLDIIDERFKKKPQPGYFSGYRHMDDSEIRKCDELMKRVKADNPTVIPSTFHQKCPRGFRKGYAAIDTSDNPDYHFYRLNNDGTWSHKPGATEVRLEDYDGKIIVRPDISRRQSSSHYYNKSCGYFCFNPQRSNISNKMNDRSRSGGGKKTKKKSRVNRQKNKNKTKTLKDARRKKNRKQESV